MPSDMCTQRKLRSVTSIRTAGSESSLSAFWIAKDAKFLHVDNAQADLRHRCANILEGTFSQFVVFKI